MIALLAPLLAAGHLYVLPWRALFLLPVAGEKTCAISSVRYGPPDGKWERGTHQDKPASCEFRQFVLPGPLLPSWVERAEMSEVEVTYTVQGSEKVQSISLRAEPLDPAPLRVGGTQLAGAATKSKGVVRVQVTNRGTGPVLLGDALAARNQPRDPCLGPGPVAVVQPGESLVDLRTGLLSKSMRIWVAAFTGPRQCRWVEASARKP
jgi:hypothetical protein